MVYALSKFQMVLEAEQGWEEAERLVSDALLLPHVRLAKRLAYALPAPRTACLESGASFDALVTFSCHRYLKVAQLGQHFPPPSPKSPHPLNHFLRRCVHRLWTLHPEDVSMLYLHKMAAVALTAFAFSLVLILAAGSITHAW